MSNDEQALLKAICLDKADDTVRLAYADWLEENNRQERGQFIRVQCELARLNAPVVIRPDTVGANRQYVIIHECDVGKLSQGSWVKFEYNGSSFHGIVKFIGKGNNTTQTRFVAIKPKAYPCWKEVNQLRKQEERLLDEFKKDWKPPYKFLPTSIDSIWNGVDDSITWKRGFVSGIRCSSLDWLHHADELCWQGGDFPYAAIPLESVQITDRPIIPGQVHREQGTRYFLSCRGIPDRILKIPHPMFHDGRFPSLKQLMEAEWLGVKFDVR